MIEHSAASPSAPGRFLCGAACLSLLVLGGGPAGALPLIPVEPTPGLLLVQHGPPGAGQPAGEDPRAALADLNEVLGATRAKIEELTEATAALAADAERRDALPVLKAENERLAAELAEASARRDELERSADLAQARLAELTRVAETARRDAARLGEDLAGLRRQNERLNQSLARADAARAAALEEAESARADAAGKLGAASDEVERLRVELSARSEELEARRRELADAERARAQAEARVVALGEVVERSGGETERLEAELAEAKAQLDQAAGAAVAAERARQAASAEAQARRGEAQRARDELVAAKDESARLAAAKAELEREIASLQTDWRSATEAARHNLMVMEEKIEQLNVALERARPEEAPAADHGAPPEAVEDAPDAASRAPSTTVQPPRAAAEGRAEAEPPTVLPLIGVAAARAESAPAETAPAETATAALERLIASLPDPISAHEGGRPDLIVSPEPIMTDEQIKAALTGTAGAGSTGAPEREAAHRAPSAEAPPPAPKPAEGATTVALADPTATPPKRDAGLASFQANLQSLNQLERSAVGVDLFSGIESVKDGEVSVSATAAWDSLPGVGKQSYLDYLLDAWVAVRPGPGPATVRIVDPSGRLLVQKSLP